MLRLWRKLLWARRLQRAQWDVAYYRNGVAHFAQELRRAKARVEAIERARINVDYPGPRGVTGDVA